MDPSLHDSLDNGASKKCVIKGDDPSLPDQLQTEFKVIVVSIFVRINESKVEGVLLSSSYQVAECLGSGGDLQLDEVGHSGLGPVCPGQLGVGVTHVTRHHHPVYKVRVVTLVTVIREGFKNSSSID